MMTDKQSIEQFAYDCEKDTVTAQHGYGRNVECFYRNHGSDTDTARQVILCVGFLWVGVIHRWLYRLQDKSKRKSKMEVVEKRESGRIKDSASKRILDKATRKRRQQRQLEALEKDNTHEDPHGHLNVLQAKIRIPAFNDTMDEKKKKKKSKTGEHFKQRFKRTFAALLEEAQQELEEDEPSYASANVPSSRFPERHFCAVCGFPSNYTCISCGARYCCVKCLGTHQDTRCLKWTV